MAQPGRLQVYTGNGKGKTTAALGLAIRAAGAGLHVYIAQFAKGRRCSEHTALERFGDLITIRQFGTGSFIVDNASTDDIALARHGFDDIKKIIGEGRHDLVILDEGNIALQYGLIDQANLLDLIANRPPHIEIVITGRNAPQALIDMADLVTEMKDVRHYGDQGVMARTGIEM